jgi:predicted nucleic acid-binding protein
MEEYAIGDGESFKPNISVFREVFSSIRPELDNELLPFFNYDASSGEIWVISCARLHPEYCCVIDEAFDRNICNLVNVKLIGTIGIISEMKLCGILDIEDLKSIRNTIKTCRFYLSKELLQKLDLICQS